MRTNNFLHLRSSEIFNRNYSLEQGNQSAEVSCLPGAVAGIAPSVMSSARFINKHFRNFVLSLYDVYTQRVQS